MRKNMKIVCSILTAVMLVTGSTACSNAKEETITPDISAAEENNVLSEQNGANADQDPLPGSNLIMEEANTILAQISAIDGKTITLALAEQPSMPDMSELPEGSRREGMGEAPSGERSTDSGPGGEKPRGEVPDGEKPMGETPDGERPAGGWSAGEEPGGDMPDGEIGDGQMPGGRANGMPGGGVSQMQLTLTGETMTIEITDSTIITVNGESATIDDLFVEDVVTVTMEDGSVNSIMSGFGRG